MGANKLKFTKHMERLPRSPGEYPSVGKNLQCPRESAQPTVRGTSRTVAVGLKGCDGRDARSIGEGESHAVGRSEATPSEAKQNQVRATLRSDPAPILFC